MATGEWASAKQTLQLGDDTMGTVYRYSDVGLHQFDRMESIGSQYQYFRITKVTMKFKPYADTFAIGTNAQVPYLHYVIMKGDNLDPNTFSALRDAGARPIRFDDKTITVSWKPRILEYNLRKVGDIVTPAFGTSRVSPWLPTNLFAGQTPSTFFGSDIQHYGILYGVEGGDSAVASKFGLEVTVHFQFKDPQPTQQGSSGVATVKLSNPEAPKPAEPGV